MKLQDNDSYTHIREPLSSIKLRVTENMLNGYM